MIRAHKLALLLAIITGLSFSTIGNQAIALSANPLPGGIILTPLTPTEKPQPKAFFGHRRLMVIPFQGFWHAVVGIPTHTLPGKYIVRFIDENQRSADAGFTISPQRRIETLPPLTTNELPILEADLENRISAAVKHWREKEMPPLLLSYPDEASIVYSFGRQYLDAEKKIHSHRGIWLSARASTPLNAPADGIVTDIFEQNDGRFTVIIDHGQSLMSVFSHIAAAIVKAEQPISRGESIGQVPRDGDSTSGKFEWRVYLNGQTINPFSFIQTTS